MMIGLVEFCNKLAVDVFEIYIIIRLLRAIFKNDLIDKRFLFLSVVIKLTLSIVVDYYAPYVLVNLLVGTIPILLLVCCYRSVWWKKIAVTFLIIALLVLSEIILAVIIGIDDYGIMAKAQNQQSIALFLSRVIFWIIALFVQRLIPQYNVVKSSAKMTALEIVIFLAMICELFALCVRAGDNLLLESLILLGSEVTVYLMIYLQDCWEELCVRRERASLIEQEKEYYRREAAIITDKQELEKQFRHDWRNRLQVLRQISETEDISQLKEYLAEIEKKTEEQTVFSNTGNLIIDSIINSKLSEAVDKDISVSAHVMLPADVIINTDDMVVILGNLLDNAIEACERLSTDKRLELMLKFEDGCIIVSVRNSFDGNINRKGNVLVSLKSDKALHGIGLQSVRHTVEKYNGEIKISALNNIFSVDAILYA